MRDIYDEAMTGVLRRIADGGRDEALFGGGLGRALDAYHRLSTQSAKPVILIEFPLLGEPSFDVGVGAYRGVLEPGALLFDQSLVVAQIALDWLAAWQGEPRPDLFFELDESGGVDQKPAIHCKNRGQLDTALAFFDAIGESWRAPLFREVVQRLPSGWFASYAALFPERPGRMTRLEATLVDDAREVLASGPSHARACLDAIGFPHYNESMLVEISRLASESRAVSVQFDIREDGTLHDVFSLVSYFEGTGADFHALFEPDGHANRVFRLYEDLHAADDRWRHIEGALFAKSYCEILGGTPTMVTGLSLPCCSKAKWKAGSLLPAKFYLTALVVL